MPEDTPLLPTTREDAVCALARALRLTRQPADHGEMQGYPDSFMARIAAEHVADSLDACGFAIAQKSAGPDHGTAPMPFLAP